MVSVQPWALINCRSIAMRMVLYCQFAAIRHGVPGVGGKIQPGSGLSVPGRQEDRLKFSFDSSILHSMSSRKAWVINFSKPWTTSFKSTIFESSGCSLLKVKSDFVRLAARSPQLIGCVRHVCATDRPKASAFPGLYRSR